MDKLRILVADDHELIRRGVCTLLSGRKDWAVVGEAGNGRDAIRLAMELKPNIAILDFSMPDMNGPAVARELARQSPMTRVILLTMHDAEAVIREVIDSGIRGMVLKSDADQNLTEAVDAIAQGRHFFTSRVSELLLKGYLTQKENGVQFADEPQLTVREQQVVTLLASGMTSKEVASALQISVRTAESHRMNINRKFQFKSVADLVRYAIRANLTPQA